MSTFKIRTRKTKLESLENRNLLAGDPPMPIDHVRTVAEDSGEIRIAVITDDIVGNDDPGDPLELVEVTSVGNAAGTVRIEDFLIFYTPAPNFAGVDTFTYTVTDSITNPNITGASGTANITINVIGSNDPPTAVNDSFSGAGTEVVTGNVLTNDIDIDGDTLTLNTNPAVAPTKGSLVLNSNGNFSYTPNAGSSGNDTFTYRMSDGTVSDTAVVTISINGSPVARNDSFSVNQGDTLSGNVLSNNGNGADSDPEGDSLSVNTSPVSGPSNGTLSLNANGTFDYTPTGNFSGSDSFVYRVSDGQSSSTATVNITVSSVNSPPTAQNDSLSGNEDNPITGNVFADNGNGADSDPDGGTLSATALNQPSDGSLSLSGNGNFTYTPNANFNGTDSFTYRLSDGQGGTDDATVTLNVAAVNDAPVLTNDSFTTDEGQPVSGNVLTNDSDVDGDTLAVVIAQSGNAANGSVTINANGSFTYTPDGGFNGSDSFTYAATDGQETVQATVSITVNAVNDPPVAQDDSFSGDEDNAISGDVGADNGNGADSDPDGDPLTTTVLTQPSNGTLVLNDGGDFTYTPNANFNGVDSFTYRIDDGNGATDDATVTLTIAAINDEPVGANDAFSTDENAAVSGNVLDDNGLGADLDVDGDPLTVSTTPVTAPSNGSLTLNADGSFTYTPNNNFTGSDSFVYELSDGQATDTATVTIAVAFVNDDPVATDDSFSGPEDNAINGNVLADNGNGADSDPEGAQLTASIVSQPSNGSLTLNSDGSFEYTPNENFNGDDSFTYRAEDGVGGSDEATVSLTIEPVNDAPVARDDSFSIDENVTLNGNVLDNNGSGSDSDVDGDPLTVVTTPTVAPSNGSLTLNADGSFEYVPNQNFNGIDTFSYDVSDGMATDGGTVQISVASVNNPPVANDDSFSGTEDVAVTGNVLADNGNGPDSDTEGAQLSVTLLTQAANGEVDLDADGDFTYTPNQDFNGTDSFTYSVSDQAGGTDDATVNISLSPVNDAPVANDDSFSANFETQVSGDLLANNGAGVDSDVDGDPLTVNTTPETAPSNGSVTIDASGSFTYIPNAGFSGTDSFVYRLTDGNLSDTATVNITVGSATNTQPVAADDAFDVNEDDSRSGNVLSDNGNGADADSDGDALTVAILSGPANGTIDLMDDGGFSYTPNANFNGQDSFSYTLSDGNGGSDTGNASITVNPVNDQPTPQDDSFSVLSTRTLEGNVLDDNGNGADSDIDSANLTVTTTPVVAPANGTLELNADGSFSYEPNAGFSGNDSFVYTLNDGDGASSTATVSITVFGGSNQAPVAQDDAFEGYQDEVITGNVLMDNGSGADADPNGSRLSVSGPVTAPTNGTVQIDSSGQFTYTPNDDFFGTDSFTYEISDGALTDVGTVDLTILQVGGVPVAQPDNFWMLLNTTLSGDVTADNGSGPDEDPDRKGLTVELSRRGGARNGSLTLNDDGTFEYTPNQNFFGLDRFSYLITDASGDVHFTTAFFTIQETNDAPVAADDTFEGNEDEAVMGNVLDDNGAGADSDPEGARLNVSVTTEPANGTLTLEPDGDFSYVPNANFNGEDSFTYELSDLIDGTDSAVVSITVAAVNDAPTAQDDFFATALNTPVSGNVLADNGSGADADAEGQRLSVDTTPTVAPANGTVELLEGGLFTYTPNDGYSGPDQFSYTTTDGVGGSSTATVFIVVEAGSATAPQVVGVTQNPTSNVFDRIEEVAIQFDASVENSLDASDLVVVGPGGQTVDTSSATVQWDASTNTATWDLSGSQFELGRYTIQLASANITDAAGRELDGDADGSAGGDFTDEILLTFAGDADLNLEVNFLDFLALARSFGQLNATWQQGDFNGNGEVQFIDFLVLANNFGSIWSADGTPSGTPAPLGSSFLFFASNIDSVFALQDFME